LLYNNYLNDAGACAGWVKRNLRIELGGKVDPSVKSQNLITITESDVANAIASGEASQYGFSAKDLAIAFSPDKFTVTASTFSYGLIHIRNFSFTGNLVTQNGEVQLVNTTVSPRVLRLIIPIAEWSIKFQLQKAHLNIQGIQIKTGRVEIILR
jgi:hypothetical protein